MEIMKFKGYFHLPEFPDKEIPGILTFTQEEGIVLELIGKISDFHSQPLIILGRSSDGSALALYRNFEKTITFSGIPSTTYKASYLFTGINFTNQRDLSFKTIGCSFSMLTNWLFQQRRINYEFNDSTNEFFVKSSPPESRTIVLPDKSKLTLQLSQSIKAERSPIEKVVIEQESYIWLEYEKRIVFEKLLDALKHFQNLMTFVSLEPSYPKDITLNFRTKGKKMMHKAKLFLHIPESNDYARSTKTLNYFLFSFSTVPDKIESILYRWYEIKDKLGLIMNVYCSCYYNSRMYQEDKFLCMVTCLESFHREFRNKKNDYYFINRCKELFEEGRSGFNWLLKIRSKSKFCNELKDYRNDLTHNNPEKKRRTKNLHKLFRLTEYAKIIFITVLLKELGLTNDEIKNLYQKSGLIRKI